VVLFLVDASMEPDDEDKQAASLLWSLRRHPELILGLNKIDKIPSQAVEAVRAMYQVLVPEAPALAFSAASRQGLKELLETLTARLPGPPGGVPRRTNHRPVRARDCR